MLRGQRFEQVSLERSALRFRHPDGDLGPLHVHRGEVFDDDGSHAFLGFVRQAIRHAVATIVEDADDHRHPILRGRRQLGCMEHEPPVTVNDERTPAAADRRADRHR